MPVDDLQRPAAIGSAQPRVPPSLQHPLGQLADLFLVLHDEYRLRSTRRGGRAPRRLRRLRQLGHSREIDLEGGAVAQLAVRPDVPAALLDDTVDRGEPESRTPPRLFGREKRLEQPRLGRAIHADTCVADGEQHVRAWQGWYMPCDVT